MKLNKGQKGRHGKNYPPGAGKSRPGGYDIEGLQQRPGFLSRNWPL